jgi:hypothetical protein
VRIFPVAAWLAAAKDIAARRVKMRDLVTWKSLASVVTKAAWQKMWKKTWPRTNRGSPQPALLFLGRSQRVRAQHRRKLALYAMFRAEAALVEL